MSEPLKFASYLPVFLGIRENDPSALLNWFNGIEAKFKLVPRPIPETDKVNIAISRLEDEYLAWAVGKEFASWADFRYQLFNQVYYFRGTLGKYVRREVNQTKRLIDQHDVYVFQLLPRLVQQIEHIYTILHPYEPWVEQFDLGSAYTRINALNKEFRDSRIKLNQLTFKDELTDADEDILFNDTEAKQFWENYKQFTTGFLTEALKLTFARDSLVSEFDEIKIGKLSVKILDAL